jgi:hypothetical protein
MENPLDREFTSLKAWNNIKLVFGQIHISLSRATKGVVAPESAKKMIENE